MANAERGEVEIQITRVENRGKDNQEEVTKAYTLKLSMNAAATLENKLKKKISEILNEASTLDFRVIREVVFMLLQKFHSAEFKTVESAGDFIDDAGGIKVFFDSLGKLAQVNSPGGGSAENPPNAQDGTGDASSLRLVESA